MELAHLRNNQDASESPGISVVIPCLNEAETLERAVIQALSGIRRAGIPGEVIVADNGSTDGSRGIASAAGARVVPVPERGYGAALDGGIRAAKYAWITFADADLSYPFDEIPLIIEPLASGKADFVLGSRLRGVIDRGAMPLLNRYLGTPVLSFLIRRFYGIPASDCNSGMRAFKRSDYERLGLRCPGMEYASELLIRAGQHRLRYAEVPISFHKDARSRPPHLRRWRDGWRHLRFILGNGPAATVVGLPVSISMALLGFALTFSNQGLWQHNQPIRYHSAFIAIAMAVPSLMFTISALLIKAALHGSGQVESRLMRMIQKWSEESRPIQLSLLFFLLVGVEAALVVYKWSQVGWGQLNEIGAIIRIMVYTIMAASLFSLDIGLGILKLIPYRARFSPPSAEKETLKAAS